MYYFVLSVIFFHQAAAAVKKYPLPLSCGEEALILDNIGKYMYYLINNKVILIN